MSGAIITLLISYFVWILPIPWNLVQAPALEWLKAFDAAQTVNIVGWLGVPAVLHGTFIYLPGMGLEVADSCSGIESMRALLILSIAYAYLLPISPIGRLAIVASALPVAALSNLLRIVITTLLAYQVGPAALDSWFHQLAGTFNFVLSLLLLGLIGEVLRGRYEQLFAERYSLRITG